MMLLLPWRSVSCSSGLDVKSTKSVSPDSPGFGCFLDVSEKDFSVILISFQDFSLIYFSEIAMCDGIVYLYVQLILTCTVMETRIVLFDDVTQWQHAWWEY